MSFQRVFRRLALAMLGAAALAAPVRAETLVLKNFNLIDGTGGAMKPGSAMVVDNGRIAWIGPAAKLKAPAGAEVKDLAGKYVMPGMIDLHVHVGLVKDLKLDIDNYSRELVQSELSQYAAYGVTTVQVMGTDKDLVFTLRGEQRASGRPKMARIYTAGQGLVFKGGYGGVPRLNEPVATPDEARKAVDVQADKGVDLIKLWVDDELGTMGKMPPEVSAAVIDQAHKRGLRAIAHIFYLDDAKRLVDQGVDGLAHSVRDKPVDAALISAMKARHTVQIAETLAREEAVFEFGAPTPTLNDPFFRQAASPASLEMMASPERQKQIASAPHFHDLPKFLEQAKANLKVLQKAGVPYGFGTDAGAAGRFPGYSEHEELSLMVESGLTPAQAIHAATGEAAQFLKAKDLGTLEVGKWADAVVLDANPLADIKNSRTIRAVYVAGQSVPSIKR